METPLWRTMLETEENLVEMYNQALLLLCKAEALYRRLEVRVLICFEARDDIKAAMKYMEELHRICEKAEEAYSLFKIACLADCIKEMDNLVKCLSVIDKCVQQRVRRMKRKKNKCS